MFLCLLQIFASGHSLCIFLNCHPDGHLRCSINNWTYTGDFKVNINIQTPNYINQSDLNSIILMTRKIGLKCLKGSKSSNSAVTQHLRTAVKTNVSIWGNMKNPKQSLSSLSVWIDQHGLFDLAPQLMTRNSWPGFYIVFDTAQI